MGIFFLFVFASILVLPISFRIAPFALRQQNDKIAYAILQDIL